MIVVPSLEIGGGAEKIASILGTNLHKKYDVHFFAFYDVQQRYPFTGTYYSRKEKKNKSIFVNAAKMLQRAKDIATYAKKHRVTHIISFMEEQNFSAIISKVFYKKPKVIVSVRNNPDRHASSKVYYMLIKQLYPFAHKVVCVAKGVELRIKTIYSLGNTTTIYNMINVDRMNRKYKKYPAFTFINIGRLVQPKGHSFLIRSFSQVVKKHEKVQLLILGEGDDKQKLKILIQKLDLQKNVHLLGQKKDVNKYLVKSHSFVLSSIFEGFCNVLLEALKMNIPVISTDCDYGPGEILAPECSMKQRNRYPYFGTYGILVKKFCVKENFADTLQEPLSEEEKILAQIMEKTMTVKKISTTYTDVAKRIRDFDVEKIIEEWEKLLK